jgi:hypothetical protein
VHVEVLVSFTIFRRLWNLLMTPAYLARKLRGHDPSH